MMEGVASNSADFVEIDDEITLKLPNHGEHRVLDPQSDRRPRDEVVAELYELKRQLALNSATATTVVASVPTSGEPLASTSSSGPQDPAEGSGAMNSAAATSAVASAPTRSTLIASATSGPQDQEEGSVRMELAVVKQIVQSMAIGTIPVSTRPIPFFYGGSIDDDGKSAISVKAFLQAIEGSTRGYDSSDARRIQLVHQHVRGVAAEAFNDPEWDAMKDWATLKKMMFEKFKNSFATTDCFGTISRQVRKKKESFRVFLARLRLMAVNMHDKHDTSMKEKEIAIRQAILGSVPPECHYFMPRDLPLDTAVSNLEDYLEGCHQFRLRTVDIAKESDSKTQSPKSVPLSSPPIASIQGDSNQPPRKRKRCQVCTSTDHWTDECHELRNLLANRHNYSSSSQPHPERRLDGAHGYDGRKSSGHGYGGRRRGANGYDGRRYGGRNYDERRRCFKCNRQGHIARDCTPPSQAKNGVAALTLAPRNHPGPSPAASGWPPATTPGPQGRQ